MIKLIIAFSFLLIAFSLQAQIDQHFTAFAPSLDSLFSHVGKQDQPVFVEGRFSKNDGFAGWYIYDSTDTRAEIPYQRFAVTGRTDGRWNLIQLVSTGGSDTTIYNNPDYEVLDILTIPPSSPSTGDKYLSGQFHNSGSAGAWIGEDTYIQEWNGTIWVPTAPTQQLILTDDANDHVYQFNGTDWIDITSTQIFHNGLDNYGNINLNIGNKKNKGLYFSTNNIKRAFISNTGHLFLYYLSNYVSGDSVLTVHNGEIRRAPFSAFGGGLGSTNLNIGAAYRWAVPGTNNIKTFHAGLGFLIDSSSHTNELTGKLDTAYLNTLYANTTIRITSSDFTTSVNYVNTSFAGKVPYVFYNNINRNLYFGTEYDTLSGGGIKLLLWTATSGDYYYISGSNLVANIGGSGGSVAPVVQTHTSGSTVTVNDGTNVLIINPTSTISSLTITLPATANTDGTLKIFFGGTLTSGSVVTSLTIIGNTGQTILQAAAPTSANAGESVGYFLAPSSTTWRSN
jgi:hypothetical protein